MDEKGQIVIAVSAAVGAAVWYLFGGWTIMLQALLILVFVDWVTGWAAAWIHGELRSMKGFIGVAKKISIFIFVTVAHIIDAVLGDMHYLRDTVVFFYLANELLSIIENAGKMGVPMPPIFKDAVALLESKSGTKQENGGNNDVNDEPGEK
ncbi:phage holin family protein [Paenibacillus monticola]|uniref:Holin n=1 Tax=Paenibacillus monticola TaxID=2666075 RepID=A0A7X2L501_9BACL|nr:phage holin family protein [Paenibacillus monticola]MRN57039.1 holin [Paenibacillus monticola]